MNLDKCGDEFWSVAMNGGESRLLPQDDYDGFDSDDDECETIVRTITTHAPETSKLRPLVLRLGQNRSAGCLSDVSGDVWDASLLLAIFLYGTNEGQQLCYNACFGKAAQVDGGGILELGSGLGLSGMDAAAAVLAYAKSASNECSSRVVLTDLNDDNILSLLSQNVTTNLSEIGIGMDSNLSIQVQPCNWIDIANSGANADDSPIGTFNLILGSELIYVPDHAIACAKTISFYLSQSVSSQAIIIQLPERAGFETFLSSCREMGLVVSSRPVIEEVLLRVEGKLASASDYRMYFITTQKNF